MDVVDANQTFNEINEELASSLIKIELKTGELIVETKKLQKTSSLYFESEVGVAGVRGTAFRLKANENSQILKVLKGQSTYWIKSGN